MIKIVYDIKVYREGLRDIVKEDDVVVELGCHVGNSTRIISQMAPYGRIISLDKSSQSEEKMQELTKEEGSLIEFIKGDVRLHEVLEEVAEKVNKIGGCDVLSIDLGGGYHPDTAFKVFFIWSSTLKPRETIIRNRGLLDFIHSSTSSEIINSNYGWLESCGDDGIPTRLKELKLWSPKL
ncbi:MAG: SAM-dependent methyltransferase [Euryarchaeota archaeon]|jgi:23S rRNA U2552 (ribose-2'-O)-methylase RlmE/FtsJ|uniref:SAM-dependent methyltransferase n=1 Tax=Methanobacterium sp. MZD130B TaxID=3394378 RepID=UPI00176894A3|nr:SAM-dependent methyltransferase [Euryarchaeota archaeon]HHT18907.1 class I SAM-dependent methyltransferase [Methanobacterium sp.]